MRRGVPSVRRVLVSFVVRLAPAALAAGALAGEVEHVATGARLSFRDADELVSWCAAASAATTVPGPRAVPAPSEVP